MQLQRTHQNPWVQAATRAHMVLSGALSDDTLDQMAGLSETRHLVVGPVLQAA